MDHLRSYEMKIRAPEVVTIEGIGDFTRVPDKPAAGAVSSN